MKWIIKIADVIGAVKNWLKARFSKKSPTGSVVTISPPSYVKNVPEEANPMEEQKKTIEFNRNNIITDAEFIETPADFDIQAFLKRYNSFLKDYSCTLSDNTTKTAIEAIKEAGKYISERVIVTQLEKEMGLIRMQAVPSANRLKWAMGYGVDDGAPAEWLCSTTGVYKQIVSAAKSMRKRFDETAESFIGKNISESFISKWDKVKDGIVLPENKATVCLYAYTPWIGERDQLIGKYNYKSPFGNYLFWVIWQKFFGNAI